MLNNDVLKIYRTELHPGALRPGSWLVSQDAFVVGCADGCLSLTEIQLPDLTTGPHYAYALQWALFALVILVGRIELFRRSIQEIKQ